MCLEASDPLRKDLDAVILLLPVAAEALVIPAFCMSTGLQKMGRHFACLAPERSQEVVGKAELG